MKASRPPPTIPIFSFRIISVTFPLVLWIKAASETAEALQLKLAFSIILYLYSDLKTLQRSQLCSASDEIGKIGLSVS